MSADNILFRCSSLGHIMTEPRSKSETLSETTKTHLVDKFVSVKYGRETDIHSRYTTKGLMVEEDSITLFSRHTKTFYMKNEETLTNEFISGTPDLYEGEDIRSADRIIDVKSSWDIYTFFRAANNGLNKRYFWQLQGYMALTGAKTATLAYCLVNTPEVLITDQKRKLSWSMNLIDADTDTNYQQACEEINKLSVYDDIPMGERIYQITVERDDEAIERLYERVKACRKWMNENLFKIQEPIAA